jgi:pimeloyl-ACP methyl ester carboxylesterase
MAGHSFAGQEMTRFVRTYPGRVIKLVYLDGWDSNDAANAPNPIVCVPR